MSDASAKIAATLLTAGLDANLNAVALARGIPTL
jgi:hypothetical protein